MQTLTQQELTVTAFDGAELAATLYRPAGPAIAAVVDLHGGAWTAGDRTMNVAIAKHLALNGIASLALEFRMPPHAVYPETVRDVAAGMLWVKRNAVDLGIAAMNVGILGTSSGGHLALLAALRPSNPRYAGDSNGSSADTRAAFAVACWPVSDPVARYAMVQCNGMQKLVDAHVAFWGDEVAMLEGSPLHIVARGEAEHLPPLLIVQGTADENLTPDMQDRFVSEYRARGGSVELHVYPGEAHGFIARDEQSAASRDALERIAAFIARSVQTVPKDY